MCLACRASRAPPPTPLHGRIIHPPPRATPQLSAIAAAAPADQPILLLGDTNMREAESDGPRRLGLADGWEAAGRPRGARWSWDTTRNLYYEGGHRYTARCARQTRERCGSRACCVLPIQGRRCVRPLLAWRARQAVGQCCAGGGWEACLARVAVTLFLSPPRPPVSQV
jgi:hypothetical protein